MHALVNYGSLAISVDASDWSAYSSGIANPCKGKDNVAGQALGVFYIFRYLGLR